jgi:hypothetical protein
MSTLALVRAGRSAGGPAVWSALCALAALARPNMALVWLLGLPWAARRGGHPVRTLAICLLVFAAVLTPWTYRNHVIHKRLVFVTTMGGRVLLEGNNAIVANDPRIRGWSANADRLAEATLVRGLTEAEADRAYFRLAVRYVLDHPEVLPSLVVAKFLRVWNVLPHVEAGARRWVAVCHASLMIVFFIVGLTVGFRRREPFLLPLLLPAIGVTLTAMIYWGDARIRAPAEPTILLVAACGAAALLRGRDFAAPRPGSALDRQGTSEL